MKLPAGWSEAITTSSLLLVFLILVGVSLIVLFLAPFFFKLVRKVKFPEGLSFVKRQPKSSLAATGLKKLLAPKYFRLSVLVFLILVLLLTTLVILTKQTKKSDEPPIVNPKGKVAFKYFPEGGNAPDFRDGSNGALEVTLERKGQEMDLSWSTAVQVSVVKVSDLGKIYKLKDQKLVWQIQNYDPKNPAATDQTKASYISPPYKVGDKPKGFFLVAGNQNLSLTKGARYSIELLGVNQQGMPTLGVYTFTY